MSTAKKAATKKAPAKKAPEKKASQHNGRTPSFTLPVDHPLEVAARMIEGGKPAICALLGITRNTLRSAERRAHNGVPFPPSYVLPICQVTGQLPSEFRSDLYLPGWKLPGVKRRKDPGVAKS